MLPRVLAVGVICVALLAQQPATSSFQTVSIMDDPRHVGGEAYRILAPAGWRAEGSVMWKNSASDSASPWIKLVGPARQEIGILPPTTFIWNPQMLGARYRPGSFYSSTEVQPPMLDPAQCIRSIIVPRYLRNLDNADVVKQESLPDLAQAGRLKYAQPAYQNAVFQAGRIRFEYLESGVAMEEDVYVLTVAVQVHTGQTVSTVWAPDEIRYSKAPKGTLDAQAPLLQTAMFSLRPNLKWWARVQQVSEELGRLRAQSSTSAAAQAMQQQAAAADRAYTNRKLDQSGGQISEVIEKRYQNRQAIMDRINERWDARRLVETYRNPAGGENIELPSGYSAAWVNKKGDYLVAGSPDYDPNSDSGGGWERLEKVQK
jgi:hypothetical protein